MHRFYKRKNGHYPDQWCVKSFIFSLVLLFPSLAICQVSGIVVDQQTNDAISGASIAIIDEESGAITDVNGTFELKIPSYPVILKVTFVGYQTLEIVIPGATDDLRIELVPEIIEGEQVTVSAGRLRFNEQVARPLPISRVRPAHMERPSPASAPELLKTEPGVYVQQTTIGQGSVYVRGRAGRDVLYLFNNFRLNPGFVRSGQNQYFGSIDPFAVSEISVYRGPVAVFYGSDALSGGVHVQPDIPSFADTTTTGGRFVSQTNFMGTGELTFNGNIIHQQENFSLSLNGTWRDFRYYTMPKSSGEDRWFPYDRTLDLAEMNFQALQATSRIRLSNAIQLALVSYYSEIPDAPRLDRMTLGYDIENSPVPTQPVSGYYSNTAPLVFSAHSATAHISSNSPFFSNLKFQAGFHRLRDDRVERSFEDAPVFSYNPGERKKEFTLSEEKETDRNRSDQWLISADFTSPLAYNLTLNWGTDFIFETITSATNIDGVSAGLPRYPDGSEILSAGGFLHSQFEIHPDLLLEGGLRYSLIHNRIPFEGADSDRGFEPYEKTFSQFTGALGFRHSFNNTFDLTGNISTGFRAPNVADLAEMGIRRSDQYQTANPDLVPEKSLNIDAGFHIHTGALSMETHLFWIRYFDKIERIFTGNLVNRSGNILRPGNEPETAEEFVEVQSANAGSMDLLGVEFNGELQFIETLKAGATFNYNWGEIETPEGNREPVDRIPPANGLLYLIFEGIENLTLRPQMQYNFTHRRMSPQEMGDNRISRYGTDGFTNLQFIAIWEWERANSIQLRMFADNLLDRSYREHASALDGLTRNVTVSVTYLF